MTNFGCGKQWLWPVVILIIVLCLGLPGLSHHLAIVQVFSLFLAIWFGACTIRTIWSALYLKREVCQLWEIFLHELKSKITIEKSCEENWKKLPQTLNHCRCDLYPSVCTLWLITIIKFGCLLHGSVQGQVCWKLLAVLSSESVLDNGSGLELDDWCPYKSKPLNNSVIFFPSFINVHIQIAQSWPLPLKIRLSGGKNPRNNLVFYFLFFWISQFKTNIKA